MFGIVIGSLCFLALIGVLVHGRRRWRGYGCGSGYGPGLHGPRWFLRSLFTRLGTSAAQEKVIVEAADELRQQGEKLRGEWASSRADVAEAMRADPLDEARLGKAFARHDGLMAELRKAATGAMAKVHAVLDADQRRALAQLIENPSRFHGFGCGC
jgi:hypothetical protein